MHPGLDRLSARERDALRLLAQGFDAKSAAHRLGMSVHTLNDRLRGARQKLEVSSSCEAARLFAEAERLSSDSPASGIYPPDFFAHQEIGLAGSLSPLLDTDRPGLRAAGVRRLLILTSGVALMLFLLASATAFWFSADPTPTAVDAPPRVVATFPRAGSTIAAGPFDLSVTYDRAMNDGGFSYVQFSADSYPDCSPAPTLSKDRRTFTLRCSAIAGRRYQIGLNNPPYMNFRSSTGTSAAPYRLTFSTR